MFFEHLKGYENILINEVFHKIYVFTNKKSTLKLLANSSKWELHIHKERDSVKYIFIFLTLHLQMHHPLVVQCPRYFKLTQLLIIVEQTVYLGMLKVRFRIGRILNKVVSNLQHRSFLTLPMLKVQLWIGQILNKTLSNI